MLRLSPLVPKMVIFLRPMWVDFLGTCIGLKKQLIITSGVGAMYQMSGLSHVLKAMPGQAPFGVRQCHGPKSMVTMWRVMKLYGFLRTFL